jgi:2-hydroxymuconate-semialdehyde hydrolase
MDTQTAHPIISTDIMVDDIKVRVNRAGQPDATPILFLHGSGPGVSAMSNWAALMTAMSDRYQCIAPDLVGFGDSAHPLDPPVGMIPFNELRVQNLIALVDQLGLDGVHLVGNSLGGVIAMNLVQRIPERIASITLMGSGGIDGVPTSPGLHKLRTFFENPTEDAMRDLLSMFLYDKSVLGDRLDEIVADRVRVALRDDIRRSHIATMTGTERQSFSADDLAAISTPALVIHGREDVIMPVESSLFYARHLPDSRLVVMGRCGHWSQIEKAPQFEVLLDNFFQGRL